MVVFLKVLALFGLVALCLVRAQLTVDDLISRSKYYTYQLPAFVATRTYKGPTAVVSPWLHSRPLIARPGLDGSINVMWISSSERTYFTKFRALDDGYQNIQDYQLVGSNDYPFIGRGFVLHNDYSFGVLAYSYPNISIQYIYPNGSIAQTIQLEGPASGSTPRSPPKDDLWWGPQESLQYIASSNRYLAYYRIQGGAIAGCGAPGTNGETLKEATIGMSNITQRFCFSNAYSVMDGYIAYNSNSSRSGRVHITDCAPVTADSTVPVGAVLFQDQVIYQIWSDCRGRYGADISAARPDGSDFLFAMAAPPRAAVPGMSIILIKS